MTGASAYGSGGEWENEDQLDLADDESLPWLEAGEDEEQAAGFDTSRLILLGVLALIVLALVVGAIWFVANQTSDEPEAETVALASVLLGIVLQIFPQLVGKRVFLKNLAVVIKERRIGRFASVLGVQDCAQFRPGRRIRQIQR